MIKVKGQSRREKAQATRIKIIGAAHAEFIERGFHGSTIASIADRAGVAVQTVYFVFHTKAELISAVTDTAVMGPAAPIVPQETEWWKEMERAGGAVEALTIFIRGAAPLFGSASAISEVVRAAARTDDEVQRVHEFHEGLRRTAFRQVVHTLAAKSPIRPGLTVDSATDVLMVFFGDTTYQLFVSNYGWNHETFVSWLCLSLPELLLESAQT